ncbi:transglutaminase superfamily protein [Murinocardiopsis flavida]|uniref:Transglutaminase superfamily protein n=1 Tax=Murinocardiopsis flavida TaxID=645275 RepID=A0A2P8CF13_9ACTN|nr:lasso peptide biosynthesis B2 protein [Murinocardiopsis flavida]PSK83551.1 transglutaminase superfamily protein [Murinocardiopsis flavida]
MPQAVSYSPRSVPLGLRLTIRAVSGTAALISLLPVRRIRRLLSRLRKGAAPAASAPVLAAYQAVVAVSLPCAGPEGCLRRSLAIVLLCRLNGIWPTWCTGPKTLPPFTAHAWVEAEGRMVGEDLPDGYFRPLISVPPFVDD